MCKEFRFNEKEVRVAALSYSTISYEKGLFTTFRSAFVVANIFGNKFNDLISQRSQRVSGSDMARTPYSIHNAGLSFFVI